MKQLRSEKLRADFLFPNFRWIQEGFALESLRNDSGVNFRRNDSGFGPLSAQKSELQAKSRSDRPKVRVTAGETPRIRTESPKKRNPNGV